MKVRCNSITVMLVMCERGRRAERVGTWESSHMMQEVSSKLAFAGGKGVCG